MESYDIYNDIVERTGGDIYIGVVGPVRTGKSTFIKKFMQLLVLPNIKDVNEAQRTQDELPQSGAGRTIMTTEPKFVPDKGTQIFLAEELSFKVRLVDCVGYTVPGAIGYEEKEGPRMVVTPWYEHAIPFQEAAELGTHKVINEHSTIGLVIITDGSITEIPRENYVEAEKRVIGELQDIGKPFLIVLNSTRPEAKSTVDLAEKLEEEYGVPIIIADCLNLQRQDIHRIMQEVLYEFPLNEVRIRLPLWLDELPEEHWLKKEYDRTIQLAIKDVYKLRDMGKLVGALSDCKYTQEVYIDEMELGEGAASVSIGVQEELFFEILEEESGFEIKGDHDLFRLIRELSVAKKEYDYIAQALTNLQESGYGIVGPRLEDMTFEEPVLFKKGNQFGVKLRASAPSIHMIRANISTEVSPVFGTEKQCEDLAGFLEGEFERDPGAIWESGFLGRSLNDLVRDGIKGKLNRLPENVQEKLQETLEKIVNEGSGGLICIIL